MINNYLVLLIANIVLFSKILKAIQDIMFYRNQLKLNENKFNLFICVLI